MRQMDNRRSSWLQKEVAKQTSLESMRQRIVRAQEQLRLLESYGFHNDAARARKAHEELIRVLSERLANPISSVERMDEFPHPP